MKFCQEIFKELGDEKFNTENAIYLKDETKRFYSLV